MSDPLDSLREALKLSPDNIPLRRHLADSLLSRGQPEKAEAEFKQALQLAPSDGLLKLGLARAFFQQQKDRAALVVLEDLIRDRHAPGRATCCTPNSCCGRGMFPARSRSTSWVWRKTLRPTKAIWPSGSGLVPRTTMARLSMAASARAMCPKQRMKWKWSGRRSTSADVGGMESLKEEIRLKIIYPLTHAEMYKAYGKAIGGGILMYGPPGCGKTHLARATAGEIKAGFISVGINDVLDMWIGRSEANLHEIFQQARDNAPCVLFFDEVDALGASRADMRNSAGRHLINQFLSEMDGINANNEGVLILAATNSPWHVDAAFRRPGRFDRISVRAAARWSRAGRDSAYSTARQAGGRYRLLPRSPRRPSSSPAPISRRWSIWRSKPSSARR